MTDIVSPTSGVTVSKAPVRRDIGIKRRYAAERRFQAYGIAAITFGLVFLFILLWTVIGKGYTAFQQTAITLAARIQINPFEPMTTVTVKIVNQLTGDLEFTSPQTLVAFALGITLFCITLCLNIYALYIVRKYREQYE